MKHRILFLLAAFNLPAYPQAWSTFLDSSRAIDWSGSGFAIPNYTVSCSIQPTLLTGSGNASANATSIQNALASCDATHNVVNIPAGTYYITAVNFPDHGNQVLRGAGANATDLIATSSTGCAGLDPAICMSFTYASYNGNSAELPPSGTQQCLWTAGYSQGTTSLTFSSCGGAPPLHQLIVLDQANDSADTNGIYI